MKVIDSWVMGIFTAILGLVGLFFASRATEAATYGAGLAIAVFCAWFVIMTMGEAADRA